jgi:glycosyltransferase involved in cell wall biosynthesis
LSDLDAKPVSPGGPGRVEKRTVLLLGPSLDAVSGVSTHLKQLFASELSSGFVLKHFQVGSEGRSGDPLDTIARLIASPIALVTAVWRTGAGIVHINSSLEPKAYWRDIVYLAIAWLLRRKTVWQVHGGALPREFLPRPLGTWWLRRTLSVADAIVVLAGNELRAYREFLPHRRVVLVANAIATQSPGGMTAVAGSRSAGGPLRLAYVGRLARDKGVFEVVEAVRLLLDEGCTTRLTVAGTGGCEMVLREMVARLGLADAVTFTGAVFGDEKFRLWSSADIFAFPTYHREGLPYALLEAMIAGAVPVTCRVGAIADVITDHEHGVFVPPRDPQALARAIAQLARDRKQLAAMSQAAQRRVRERYTVTRMAREIAAVYDDLA